MPDDPACLRCGAGWDQIEPVMDRKPNGRLVPVQLVCKACGAEGPRTDAVS